MPILNCDVHNCVHNYNSECELNEIAVKGRDAAHHSATSCTTFCDTTDCYKDESDPYHTRAHASIQCTAANCQHNCDRECRASDINVSGTGANKAEHTICSTFSCH